MRRKLQVLFSVCVSFLLVATFYLQLDVFSAADREVGPLRPPISGALTSLIRRPDPHRQNLAIRELSPPARRLHSPVLESVLLPDWEVLLLLPPHATPTANSPLYCLFHNGRTSPAVQSGSIPSSDRVSFRCALPPSVRRLRPFYTPRLVGQSFPVAAGGEDLPPLPEMIRWKRLAYESVSTPDDVIVFAKGVNTRSDVNRPTAGLRCAFFLDGTVVATTGVTSSAQEVFRCAHPPGLLHAGRDSRSITVSLEIEGGEGRAALPSLATYRPPEPNKPAEKRSLICACTMVYNVAKFLREWVMYHSRIGVERFILYDNGSEDDLESMVSRLRREGYNVSTRFWPWPKTQEAGFSHCAAVEQGACSWMAFFDVDEFTFSPAWSDSAQPGKSMLGSLLPSDDPAVGQVSLGCRDFGPSGQRAHPASGVTQGYTCRRIVEERHKSIVRLEAVDSSLVNSIHHFGLGEGWETRRVATGTAAVNHYKYQAWDEFKAKFRRRVSAYVADWREAANPGSRDRTPGLGYEAVEPAGWAEKFCELNDTRLRDTARRWFGSEGPAGENRMAWEE